MRSVFINSPNSVNSVNSLDSLDSVNSLDSENSANSVKFVKLSPVKISGIKKYLPSWQSAGLAVLSAVLLILIFPGFEWRSVTLCALVPLLLAAKREKGSLSGSFLTGWLFGTCFFTGSCWWLTYSPINYAGFPVLLAYFLLVCVCLIVGVFPAIFVATLSTLIKKLGVYAMLSAPFIWTATEFLRFWITGNNWNAIGYSQAFSGPFLLFAQYGGVLMVGFLLMVINTAMLFLLTNETQNSKLRKAFFVVPFLLIITTLFIGPDTSRNRRPTGKGDTTVIAVQPNVPMSGLTGQSWSALRQKHVELAESALARSRAGATGPPRQAIVVFPESPMNFMYEEDKDFQDFVRAFAVKNNASVLFNAAEPDPANKKYFNSAVMVDASGNKVAQYDKIYLVPFGETVPAPLQNLVPALVGSFSYGREYDLLPFGEAKGGIMICFESHFPNLSREYVREGADVLIEMTNDGYLGPTPVLRQHLANAVFRAVETSRPLLRVTNVGISAYIDESGEVLEPTAGYTEDTRVWSVSKSDDGQTLYVKFGDWFAWMCMGVTISLLIFGAGRKPREPKSVQPVKPVTA